MLLTTAWATTLRPSVLHTLQILTIFMNPFVVVVIVLLLLLCTYVIRKPKSATGHQLTVVTGGGLNTHNGLWANRLTHILRLKDFGTSHLRKPEKTDAYLRFRYVPSFHRPRNGVLFYKRRCILTIGYSGLQGRVFVKKHFYQNQFIPQSKVKLEVELIQPR